MKIIRLMLITMALTFALQAGYDYKRPAIEKWIKAEVYNVKFLCFKMKYSRLLSKGVRA